MEWCTGFTFDKIWYCQLIIIVNVTRIYFSDSTSIGRHYILPVQKMLHENLTCLIVKIKFIFSSTVMHNYPQLRGWITKKHQKFNFFKCKFVTFILFGTMSESSIKIVEIVFELCALVWYWNYEGTILWYGTLWFPLYSNLFRSGQYFI